MLRLSELISVTHCADFHHLMIDIYVAQVHVHSAHSRIVKLRGPAFKESMATSLFIELSPLFQIIMPPKE